MSSEASELRPDRCELCKFACAPVAGAEYGEKRLECHRMPPTNGGGFGYFPLMRTNAWCGEFEPKAEGET